MNKDELIQVYEHTKVICADFPVPLSLKHFTKLEIDTLLKEKKGNIILEPIDTVSALIKYGDKKTAVLNFCSSKRKGGAVSTGKTAQEEELFRCSNLFMIPDAYYPIASNEFIYTHDATFVKNSDYGIITPIRADVITMPAINLNKTHIDNIQTKDSVDNYDELMTFKIEQILSSAISNGCENIILGAWGCGVFKNDPNVVADLFKKVLERADIRFQFENIVFAVINDKNSVANNYQIFLDKNQTVMGWKSSIVLTREEAIRLIMENIHSFSNEELGEGLTNLGFGDNTNLPHCGYNFNVINYKTEEE